MHARLHALALCAALAAGCAASGQRPSGEAGPARPARPPGPDAVRRLVVSVPPYYATARDPAVAPLVHVGRDFDALLASTRREDILRARDLVTEDPRLITPMTMTALAIRLYDVGLRDDAVFWFHVAKYRFVTMGAVLDFESTPAVDIRAPMDEFLRQVGPYVDGYGFCDPEKRQGQRRKALDWVEQHPYWFEGLFTFLAQNGQPGGARPGTPEANLKGAVAEIRDGIGQDQAWLGDPANRRKLEQGREEKGIAARFCWDWEPLLAAPPSDPACFEPKLAERHPGWKVCFELPSVDEAVRSLSCGGPRRQASVEAAVAAPEKLPPPALCALARALLDAGKPDEALFWNEACLLRARIDQDRCLERTYVVRHLRDGQGKRFAALQAEDPGRLAKAVDRALEWDRRAARAYDHRWVQLHTGLGAVAPPELGCQPPAFAPEDRWPAIADRARAAFERGYRQQRARPKASGDRRPAYQIVDGEVMDWEKVLPEIDPLTFEPLAGEFARDAAHAFYRGRTIPGADPATFQVIDGEYARDARAVFHGINRCKRCDAASFRRLGEALWADRSAVYVEMSSSGQCQLTSPGSEYMDLELCDHQDRSDLSRHPELDPATTVRLHREYVKDRAHVLWYWDPIPGGGRGDVHRGPRRGQGPAPLLSRQGRGSLPCEVTRRRNASHRPRRLRRAQGLARPRLPLPLGLPAPRAEALEERRLPPQDRRRAHPDPSRRGRRPPLRRALPLDRRRARARPHTGERGGGPAALLRALAPGCRGAVRIAPPCAGHPHPRRGEALLPSAPSSPARPAVPTYSSASPVPEPAPALSLEQWFRRSEPRPPTQAAPRAVLEHSTAFLDADRARLSVTVPRRVLDKLEAATDALARSTRSPWSPRQRNSRGSSTSCS
jgi:hypothetical protein